MFHGVIHRITLAQFFLRHGVCIFRPKTSQMCGVEESTDLWTDCRPYFTDRHTSGRQLRGWSVRADCSWALVSDCVDIIQRYDASTARPLLGTIRRYSDRMAFTSLLIFVLLASVLHGLYMPSISPCLCDINNMLLIYKQCMHNRDK